MNRMEPRQQTELGNTQQFPHPNSKRRPVARDKGPSINAETSQKIQIRGSVIYRIVEQKSQCRLLTAPGSR